MPILILLVGQHRPQIVHRILLLGAIMHVQVLLSNAPDVGVVSWLELSLDVV